jgi:hypothetical protein
MVARCLLNGDRDGDQHVFNSIFQETTMNIKDKLLIKFLLAAFISLAPLYYIIFALDGSLLIVKMSVIGGFVILQSILLGFVAVNQFKMRELKN